jgi:hypothetical protein
MRFAFARLETGRVVIDLERNLCACLRVMAGVITLESTALSNWASGSIVSS